MVGLTVEEMNVLLDAGGGCADDDSHPAHARCTESHFCLRCTKRIIALAYQAGFEAGVGSDEAQEAARENGAGWAQELAGSRD